MRLETSKLLWDMREAARRIESFTAGKSLTDYQNDELLRSGVERQFEIIGEAMTRLIKCDSTTAIRVTDYRKISGFRNALIHGYDSIDHIVSWGIVQTKLPVLIKELDAIQKGK